MSHESEVDEKLAASMIQQARKNITRMNDELKSLITDAAGLIGLHYSQDSDRWFNDDGHDFNFNPCDPERGDLMKVAMAARLDIEFQSGQVWAFIESGQPDYFDFVWDDHQSLALAILRAASAVLHSRGGV